MPRACPSPAGAGPERWQVENWTSIQYTKKPCHNTLANIEKYESWEARDATHVAIPRGPEGQRLSRGNRMNSDFNDVFNAEGPLAQALPGCGYRPEQAAMANAVGQALARLEPLIIEAGTGTGKTFAYLVPALLSGRSVVISTGTRTLQDQLFHRDVPLLARALGLPVKIALLKGRANYLCRHRLGV